MKLCERSNVIFIHNEGFPFQLEAQRIYADFQNQAWFLISRIDKDNIADPVIRRRLRYLSVVGPSALPPDQLDRVKNENELSIYYKFNAAENRK